MTKNFLIYSGIGASKVYRRGWSNAINFAHPVYIHDTTGAILDTCARVKPDYLMLGTWELDRATLKAIDKYKPKVILWGCNYTDIQYDPEDTVQVPSEPELENVRALLKISEVTKVYSYYHQKRLKDTHHKWQEEFNLEPVGLPLAADIIDYPLGKVTDKFKCDISFVGGYWPYKATNINKYLIPYCHPKFKDFKIKIFGYGNWPVHQNLGIINTNEMSDLFRSSTICLNIFEPLSPKYGFDVNERGYKILSSGGFCLSEYVDSAAQDIFIDGEMVFFENEDQFDNLLYYYLNNPEERKYNINRGIRSVYTRHTYFHRAIELFKQNDINGVEILENKMNEIWELTQKEI